MELNEQIRLARDAAGLSVTELAQKLGVSKQAVVWWELGPEAGGNGVHRKHFQKLEEVLGVKLQAYASSLPDDLPVGIKEEYVRLAFQIARLPKKQRELIEILVGTMIAQEASHGGTTKTSATRRNVFVRESSRHSTYEEKSQDAITAPLIKPRRKAK